MSPSRLLAVNVGLPRNVEWQGGIVHTGVWKEPVAGRRIARRLNIDGDGQGDLAGHGGEQRAVLVYQIESYRHWQQHFGRDDFTYGQFGENLTVEGLADDAVCIGDRFRIGGAVFEVTQPRVTCYRVGLRLGEPQMPALLVSHRRPGFYMRVLEEGEVGAGDDIVQIAADPAGVTVAEIDALLYLPGHPRDKAALAAAIPALSPGWRASLEALETAPATAGAGNPGLSRAGGPPPAWPGFRSLRVTGVDVESADVKSFHLAAPDGESLPPARPGQFVAVRVRPGGDAGPALVRSYSLSGRPDGGSYRISVKREPNGVASAYLHTAVAVGARLDVDTPRGTFILDDDTRPAVLVSAGVGATPVLAMLHWLVDSRSTRPVWWLHAAHDGAHHSFATEARDLVAQLADGHSFVCYSRPGHDDRPGVDYTAVGRLTRDVLGQAALPSDAALYICGPAGFMADLSAAFVTATGVRPDDVHEELFGATAAINPGVVAGVRPTRPVTSGAGTGPTVSFARSGPTVDWDPSYDSLLVLAEAAGVPTRWSCRTGVCHTCETALLAGSVSYSPEPLDAPADGNTLICCARPGADVVLDL